LSQKTIAMNGANSTCVDLSANETDVLGLKTGRCNAESLDEEALTSQILEGEYDICRLKIPAEEEMASVKLHRTGLPFYFSGSIRRYKTRITEDLPGDYYHPEMNYEMYDGSQDGLLKELLTGTWGTYPLGYYRTPYLNHLVSKEKEIESVFRFYKKYNLNKDYPSNSILFMYDKGNYVGFFALNVVGGNLESHIGGILSPYQKGGYFLDMLRYIRQYCIRHDLHYFLFGARNENAQVQKIFQEVGFKACGSENVFHLPALLSHTARPSVSLVFSLTDVTFEALSAGIYREVNSVLSQTGISGIHTFKTRYFDKKLLSGKYTITIRFPVMNDAEVLLMFRVFNPDGENIGFGYAGTQV